MPIKFQSCAGQILICDFGGYISNEIVKTRPVIAITAPSVQLRASQLCHVVPLSTTEPEKLMPYHYHFTDLPEIPGFPKKECWAKCDLIYTVSYKRLSTPYRGRTPNGRRNYLVLHVSKEQLLNVRRCVARGLQYPNCDELISVAISL